MSEDNSSSSSGNVNQNLNSYYKCMRDFEKIMKSALSSSEDAARFEGIASKIAKQAKEIYFETRKREGGLI